MNKEVEEKLMKLTEEVISIATAAARDKGKLLGLKTETSAYNMTQEKKTEIMANVQDIESAVKGRAIAVRRVLSKYKQLSDEYPDVPPMPGGLTSMF